MGHPLGLGFETPRPQIGGVDLRLGARIPAGDPEDEFGELGALGGLAVETILRRHGKHGAVVALAPRDVPAAPAELRLTGADALCQRTWARPAPSRSDRGSS
jgi:hypothetical protein